MKEYLEYGHESDQPSHIRKYVLDAIVRQLGTKKERTILDVGCGNGWLSRDLLSIGYNVYGIDASPQGIAIARNTHPDRFFLQDITSELLPEELRGIDFDTVVSTEVIEHLYNPGNYLDFIRFVLNNSPGSELVLTTPYHGYLKHLALAVTGKMDAHLNVLQVGGHIKFFSRKTLTELLHMCGFDVVHFEGCGRLPLLWKSMLVKAIIA